MGTTYGGRRIQLTIALLAGASWLALVLHYVGLLGGDSLDTLFDLYVYNGLIGLSAVACLVRAALVPTGRLGWALIGIGVAAWGAGDLYWSIALSDLDVVPVPSIADALYLALYPAVCAGLIILVRPGSRHKVPGAMHLDGAIVALAIAGTTAALTLEPIRSAAGVGIDFAVNLAYPVGDIVLLGVVAVMFSFRAWRPGPALLMLGGGLGLMAVADSIYLVQAWEGTYVEGTWLDALWPASALLVALAAWRFEAPRALPESLTGLREAVAPAVGAVLALALVTVGVFGRITPEAAVLALATLALVTIRMALAFATSRRLMAFSRQQALTDALTGLANRRMLMEDLDREVAEATAEAPRVCVILDLDGFKGYNDAFGHPAGDQLLVRLSRRLAEAVAPFGTAYRLGGDEFCVLARCHPPAAELVASAAREALSENGEGFEISSSAGIALVPAEAQDATAAIGLADERMYARKAGGRASPTRQTRDVLLRTLREREPELLEHLSDVAELAVMVGQELDMDPEQLDEVVRAAELHDVGKIAIPETILHKETPLDDAECEFMRRHTVIGERILGAAPALRPVARLVRSSHERMDGTGYPDGLEGYAIPLGSRVVAVCDAYDAMVSGRPAHPPRSAQEALAELRDCAGPQFDSDVVEAFAVAVARRDQASAEQPV